MTKRIDKSDISKNSSLSYAKRMLKLDEFWQKSKQLRKQTEKNLTRLKRLQEKRNQSLLPDADAKESSETQKGFKK